MAIQLKNRENNLEKVEELKKSMKLDAKGKPVKFHWKNDEATEFIDYIVDESANILAGFRVIQMSGPTKEIAKVLDEGRFLKPGGSYKRTYGNSGEDGYQFSFDSLTLEAKKVEGMVYISDDELDDNIEGKKWETHVKKMVAKKIANELVEVAIYGRKLEKPNPANGILNVFDGVKYICEKFGNIIDAENKEITRRIVIKAKKVLKTKYRKNVGVFMDSDIKTDFDELYNDPTGTRGDGEIIKNSVSGMQITEIPLMNSEQPVIKKDINTSISGSVSVGDKTLNVSSDLTSSLKTGDTIIVKHSKADEMSYTVNSVSANQITLKEKIIYPLETGDTVHKADLTGADLFILNKKNIIIGIQKDIEVEFERLAPDGFKIWYKMKQDVAIENPEAIVMVKNLKSKDL